MQEHRLPGDITIKWTMRTDDYDYALPPELIAQHPAEPRDSSRLMVLGRQGGPTRHLAFSDLPTCLRAGDLLVFNDSRVLPSRFYGRRTGAGGSEGGRIELLLLERMEGEVWRALVRPGRRLREGAAFRIDGLGDRDGTVIGVESDGTRVVRLPEGIDLERVGVVPMPPYVKAPLADAERYQTVYARRPGSIAAPTAGLHFTDALLDRIRSLGIETTFVTLHVGWDSFRPVTSQDPRDHRMHSEWYEISPKAAEAINRAKGERRRVVVVGTTAVRLLEANAIAGSGSIRPGRASTDLFIAEGHRFRVVDALITNFHLPRSTLLMLVSAFAGRERVLTAYANARRRGYRFYSFGDAMLIQ